jgi:hypothetical protein
VLISLSPVCLFVVDFFSFVVFVQAGGSAGGAAVKTTAAKTGVGLRASDKKEETANTAKKEEPKKAAVVVAEEVRAENPAGWSFSTDFDKAAAAICAAWTKGEHTLCFFLWRCCAN